MRQCSVQHMNLLRNLTCGVTQYLPGLCPYNILVSQTGWDSCSSLLTVNAVLRDYLC